MKIISFLLLLLIFSSFVRSAEKSGCSDFLQELNVNTKLQSELTFLSCKEINRTPAVLLESTYTVSGKKAKAIEDVLHSEFGFKRLRFVCCGYEGRELTYLSEKGETYSINMFSYDEYNKQTRLEDYKDFRVTIGKYLILP